MSLTLHIPVKEMLQELRSVLKKASPMMRPRTRRIRFLFGEYAGVLWWVLFRAVLI